MTTQVELIIAQEQYKILKTPALRAKVAKLEAELRTTKEIMKDTTQPKLTHRRRGVKCAGLIG